MRRRPTATGLLSALLMGLVPLSLLVVLVARGTAVVLPILELLGALAAIRVVTRFPGAAMLVLVVGLPLQQALLAGVYRVGVPAGAVRGLGGYKEVIVVGLSVAAVGRFSRERHRLDTLDRLVLAYLGLLAVYVVLPYVVPGVFVSVSLTVRVLALRNDGLFALAFLAVRHVGLRPSDLQRLYAAVLVVGLLIGASALLQYASQSTWNTFVNHTLQVPQFQQQVAGLSSSQQTAEFTGVIGNQSIIRVSGLSFSPLTMGFILQLPLSLALLRLSTGHLRSRFGLAAAVLLAGIVVTLTRSAILAALLTTLVVVRSGFGRQSAGRMRLLVGLALVALLLAPLAGSSEPVRRLGVTFSSSDQSTNLHRARLDIGLGVLRTEPFGRGLGAAPEIGSRYNVSGEVTSENAYLQVGDEVGLETMLVFIAMLFLLGRGLLRASRARGPDGVRAAALFAALLGVALGGLFLYVWADFPTAVVIWALGGAQLAAAQDRQEPEPDLLEEQSPIAAPRRRAAVTPVAS